LPCAQEAVHLFDIRYPGQVHSRIAISNTVFVIIRECILPEHRSPADALLASFPFCSFLACVSLKSCYWYMRVCGMSLFFLLYFSIALRTSTCFSRLTLGNVNNMYWYSRICYCFFCLHINYSNLNYFPRDLSTKKSRVLRTQTLDYSLTIAHRLILVVDPVARALHRKTLVSCPLFSSLSFYHDTFSYSRIQLIVCSPILKRGAGAQDALSLFASLNIFLSL